MEFHTVLTKCEKTFSVSIGIFTDKIIDDKVGIQKKLFHFDIR